MKAPSCRAAALALACLASCGGKTPATNAASAPRPVVAAEPPVGESRGIATDPPAAPRATCTEVAPASPAAAARARAIDALLTDRASYAVARFSEIVRQRPQDLASAMLLEASRAKLAKANASAADEADVPVTALEPAPLARAQVAEAKVPPGAAPVRLRLASEKKNLIVDDADWYKINALTPPVWRGGPEPLPDHVASAFRGAPLRALYPHADHDVALYGTRFLVASAPGKRPRVFDASRATATKGRALEVEYAHLAGGTLYLALAINGYAKEVGGKTGYVVAFDAASGRVLWSSEPLTSNANLLVAGRSIVAGYGFTAEPDFLFVLDAARGGAEQKLPLKSGPSAIVGKGDKVFVRTYDTDYVFESVAALPAALPAELADAEAAVTVDRKAARCWSSVATAAIDRRDLATLRSAMEEMRHSPSERFLDQGLAAARDHLEAQAKGARKVDLTTVDPIVLPAPPWTYQGPAAPPPRSAGKPPALVLREKKKASEVRSLSRVFSPDRPFFLAPVEHGVLPPGAPEIPPSYGMEDLSAFLPAPLGGPGRSMLVYGGRYLALLNDGVTEHVFDLDAFRHPPNPSAQWREFAVEDLTYALAQDGVLYVCNGGGSYAKEVGGKKGFLSALDAASGRLLWRSDPLVCNSTFVLAGDYLITGYGFTAEPDFLFVVRRSDGKTMSKSPVDSGPDSITVDGARLLVETYDRSYVFELR